MWLCDGVEYYHWSPSLTIIKQVRLRPGPVLSLWCLSLSRGILWNIKFLPRPKSQILRWKNRCSSRVFPEFDWQPGWVWNHQLEFRSTSSLDTAGSQHNTCPLPTSPPLATSEKTFSLSRWQTELHEPIIYKSGLSGQTEKSLITAIFLSLPEITKQIIHSCSF